MLMSTSVFSAHANEADIYREAKKQIVWFALGIVVCIAVAMIDYRVWQKWVWLILAVSAGLLCLCYVPGIGLLINGERRWIDIGPLQIQPSEIAKLSVIFLLGYWYSKFPDSGRHLFKGFLAPLSLAGVIIALVLFEVDIGTTAVLTLSTLIVLYVAGVHWAYLAGLVAAGAAGFIAMMSYAPDRVERLAAFVDPEQHRLGAGFQQWISLMALGSGDVAGRGIGEGRLKMLYMPFAHTDFIFPMIGEELGLIGTLGVIIAFASIVFASVLIAYRAPDRFGVLVATGICSILTVQAFFNIGVTTSVLPNTGLPLPFISYGGSSLLISMAAIGILVNIYRQGQIPEPRPKKERWSLDSHRETPRI